MFLHVSVILFTGEVVSKHALQVVSQHALQQVSKGEGWYPTCLQVSRPTPKEEVEGPGLGGLLPGGCLLGGVPRVPAPEEPAWGGAYSGGACLGGCGNPPMTATTAGSMHPTGMHSCLKLIFVSHRWIKNITFLVALLLKQSTTYLVCLACVCRMAYVDPPPPEMAFLLGIS